MNRLAQFIQYTGKVFGLKALLRNVRDGRSEPRVPLLPLVVCLVLGVVMRIGSYPGFRYWRLEGVKKPGNPHLTFKGLHQNYSLSSSPFWLILGGDCGGSSQPKSASNSLWSFSGCV